MEFKLKEGWGEYFMSGLFAGLFFFFLLLFYVIGVFGKLKFLDILVAIVVVLASVVLFIMGCRVKKT